MRRTSKHKARQASESAIRPNLLFEFGLSHFRRLASRLFGCKSEFEQCTVPSLLLTINPVVLNPNYFHSFRYRILSGFAEGAFLVR
jgi:hypothetical protein